MIAFISIFALLSCCAGAEVDPATLQKVSSAIDNINKYMSDNKLQALKFDDYQKGYFFIKFFGSSVALQDLSTIELKAGTQPLVDASATDIDTRYHYKAALDLKKGFVQYDLKMRLLSIFSSDSTVTATSEHSFVVEGSVIVDSVKNCKASLDSIQVSTRHFQAAVAPHGIFHSLLRPFIQFMTNSMMPQLMPLDSKIPEYIRVSIPQSQFSDLVCSAFNK